MSQTTNIPNIREFEIHIAYGEPGFTRRFGKKIKELGGKYSETRGDSSTRYVHIPFPYLQLVNSDDPGAVSERLAFVDEILCEHGVSCVFMRGETHAYAPHFDKKGLAHNDAASILEATMKAHLRYIDSVDGRAYNDVHEYTYGRLGDEYARCWRQVWKWKVEKLRQSDYKWRLAQYVHRIKITPREVFEPLIRCEDRMRLMGIFYESRPGVHRTIDDFVVDVNITLGTEFELNAMRWYTRNVNVDPRVKAIRSHPKVGENSCTSIDECYEDSELVEMLDEEGADTPEKAVKLALEMEGLFLEQGLNARFGEDDDDQLKAYNEFHGDSDV